MISIRLDRDLLQWYREGFPEGYQSKMGEVLRNYKTEKSLEVERLLGRAQEIFRQFYARCFWHLKQDMRITVKELPALRQRLRKYGGREGYELASELELEKE